jgi:L-ascorbate metabolism protein UlaG (beta-lactamase superfamily)
LKDIQYGLLAILRSGFLMVQLCKAKLVVPVHYNNRQQSIKELITKLPDTIKSNYYLNGKLVQ